MTATLDLAPAAYAVDGISALVPGTSLRLPVMPFVAHFPADQRCNGCAGTGVQHSQGTLYSCGCMELPDPPAPTSVRMHMNTKRFPTLLDGTPCVDADWLV